MISARLVMAWLGWNEMHKRGIHALCSLHFLLCFSSQFLHPCVILQTCSFITQSLLCTQPYTK